MNCNKYITLTLFICILCTVCFFLLKWLYDIVSKKTSNENKNEYFYTKRNTRIKIYRSDEIFDPDEQPEFEEYDPDDNPIKFDPNQQPYLDDEEINSDDLTIPYKIQIPYTQKKNNSKKKFRNFP